MGQKKSRITIDAASDFSHAAKSSSNELCF
jgi:hypothetical protein